MTISAIDWNHAEDSMDTMIWHKMAQNFWLPEKIALSNDLSSWETLTADEKEAVRKVFGGLTMLDTLQATTGAISLLPDSKTDHESANYTFIAAMESIHAKSYSSIFSTLCSSDEIKEVFRWVKENPILQKKAEKIKSIYEGDDPLRRKIASVFLESFMFFSGFYLPIYWASRKKLTNTADMINLIRRDEQIHGFYIGYKFKLAYDELDSDEKESLTNWAYDLLSELFEIESEYTQSIYDGMGKTEDVKAYLRYNANKALQNLGLEPLFSENSCKVSPEILAGLIGEENHDFFSGGGSTYLMGVVESTSDEDWDF